MSKSLLALIFISIFTLTVSAQEESATTKEVDSLQTNLKEEGLIVVDTLKKEKVVINPLAPSKAAFLSAMVPGLGQVYNKRYWKVPIVYGAIGAAVYGYTYNNSQYQRVRTAFKRRQAGFEDDEFFGILGDDDLQNEQENFQSDRDLLLVVSIALYALNIVDANVDAHLKQFNIDDDLSFDMEPFLDVNSVTNDPQYGMAVIIKF